MTETYPIDFTTSPAWVFPKRVEHVAIELYGKHKAFIDVEVKQVRYFKSTILGTLYAVNGEAVIGGQVKLVSSICTEAQYRAFQKDQSGMIFELMAGEAIPGEWIE